MLRRNISGRGRRRNLAGATNGQLRFSTTAAGWTVTSPPHSYFFLWNPQSGTTSGTSADKSGSNPLTRDRAAAVPELPCGDAGGGVGHEAGQCPVAHCRSLRGAFGLRECVLPAEPIPVVDGENKHEDVSPVANRGDIGHCWRAVRAALAPREFDARRMRCVGRERVPRQDCKRREANDKSKPDLHRYSTEARPLRLSRLREDGAEECA